MVRHTRRPTRLLIPLATRDADDDFGFTIEGVTLPTTPRTYVLVANGVAQSFPVQTRFMLE